MQLKPQDIVVLLKLVALGDDSWTYRSLATDLFMSTGEVHNALNRAAQAQLYDAERRLPRLQALEEFLVHGIRYAFPPERGSMTRGIATAYAAPPLKELFAIALDDQPPVWPDASGTCRGYKLEPLYGSVPKAVQKDKTLYELLSLVDAVRDGRARERALAIEQLRQRLRLDNAQAWQSH